MDTDDPIQQLLKSTGWTCDDLLEKLHKYKSQKERKEEVAVESTNEISTSDKSVSDAGELHKNAEVQDCLESVDSIKESQKSQKTVSVLRTEFSESDEEEVEVNVIHTNIVNEIIEDIDSADNSQDFSRLVEKTSSTSRNDLEEQEEITEVKVIEIDDDDDCFQEESSNGTLKQHNLLKLSPEKVQYLETFPRKTTKQTELLDSSDIIEVNANRKKENQEKESCNTKNDERSLVSSQNIQQINSTNIKKLETLSKTKNEEGSQNIINCCNDEKAISEPKGKLLSNIVDKGNTAFIYERNCEKMLYSKTQIKNSYSNCITLNSKRSNSSSTSENIKYDSFEEETTPTDLEDIRNNLKLQLSSLRKRKKCHFLQQVRTKVVDSSESNTKKLDNDNLESTKKNYPIVDLDRNNETIKCSSKSSNIEKENDQDHNIYTQTNEFGLVILSVEGGIDLEEHNEKAINSLKPVLSATNEDSSNTISSALNNSVNSLVLQNKLQNDSDAIEDSQVLDEIRRIIRKQKPNFEITEDSVNKVLRKQAKLINDFRFFRKSVENCANKLIEKPNQKNNCLSICGENSQASFVNDDTSQTIDKNSPFVSNTLEEFLTENSKLNISYKVPKCGAEEGLTDSYRDESPLLLKKVVTLDKDQGEILRKPKMIKAKTVAQKRKLLEKQRIKELRRQARIMKHQAENVVVGSNSDSVKQNKQSYVEINNKKLWVKGTKPNSCVAKITSSLELDPSLKQSHRRRKLSLLTELTKKHNEKINYRPGPLSKKSVLQINGHDNWKTETKLLPKIILEVTPKVGFCLPPEVVCRLPKCKGVVTADLAEFALSVLETKKASEEKIFKFSVKYTNNQEKIIVKKRKVIPVNYNCAEKNYKEKCTNSVVASVIDDLIRYVEIKEIAPTLIKEEETEYNSNDIELDKMPTIAENISSIIKKPYKKKSKVEMELSRLSCKVVNVEVEETSSHESCSKPYCRLGCICKSLKCDGMITYHCQNVGCMLECKCPREKSIEYDTLMLPPGTDILSRDTVTRIEDEAKKDLAKVEREFTQMVIHTNDKTIVVGTGGRHKTRRSTKAPTKYSDYIDSNFDSIVDEKSKVLEKKFSYKECFVSLKRLNLQDIIPYCLFHNTYNCLCKGEYLSSESSSPKKTLSKTNLLSEEKTEQNKVAVERKYLKNIKISPPKQLKIYKDGLIDPNVSINSESQPEMLITSTSGRPIRVNKKLKEGFTYSNALDFQLTDCARIRGIPVSMKRNRKYSRQISRKLTKGDFINNITQSDQLKANVFANFSNALEVDILKHQLILELGKRKNAMPLLADNTLNTNKHKRKQIFEVRSDDVTSKSSFNQDLAIQRRKKCGSVPRKNTIIEPVFDGEIIVDERNMELLQKMGNRTVMEGYARLLPWTALINSFNKGDIHIWCMVDQPSRLLINKNDKTPPKNYIDIRQTSQTTEVILWIKTNTLPKRYHEDHVSFILKQTKDNYEICGLCTKNFNDTNFMSGNNNENELSVTTNTDKNDVLFKHKDLNGVQQTLCISKGKFKLQELVEENLAAVGETSIQKNKLYMWAALPEIYRMCKWRMVFLNSDFTFLYFTKVRYSIKYTDLLSASNTAKESNCTVILKNSVICNPYDHSSFGIYFDSHYQDRLFIGPYFKQHKEDDIETLRYINQSLVCTESFNKMQGKTDYKCGHWLIERPYSRVKETVDLTNEMSLNKNLKRKVNTDIPQIMKKSKGNHKETEKVIITQNNDLIKVLDSEPKKPEEFNRYIITNIPHLGYLGAFQHDDSSEIDVSWPFENKMLRFPSVNSATNFLQCRFSSLLQPVPESFKINILVLTDIDLEKTKPIDASILSGHYICGEFGCYNIKTVTNEFCISKIGTTQEELLRLFAKRAQLFVRQKIEELADTVNIPKGETSRLDIVHILNKAQQNIEELRKKEKQSVMEKHELLLRKRELALKAYCLISTLPEKEKLDENWKFRQILRKKSILIPQTVVEPIEIRDSDEEEQKASSQKEDSTVQKVENNVHNLSKTVSHDSSFMDQSSDLAEIMLLSKPDSVEVASTKQSDLTISVANTNLLKKVNETLVCQYPSQKNLKSILKSNTTTTTNTSTSNNISNKIDENEIVPKPHYLTGIKLVKTNEGKLLLVSDNKTVSESPFKFSSVGGKQVVIKNSQILSIKSISPQNNGNVQTVSVPENASNHFNSPPKTIVLKKSSLLKRPRVLLPKDMMPIVNEMKSNEKSLLKNNKLSEVVLKKHEKLTGSLVKKDETHSKPHVSTGKETVKYKSCDRIIDTNVTTENKQPNTFENILQEAIVPESISERGIDEEKNNRDIAISTSGNNSSNFALTEKDFSDESRRLTTDYKFLLKPPNIDVEVAVTSCSDSFPDQSKVTSAIDKETKTVSEKETNRSYSVIENEIGSDKMIEPPKETVEKPDTNTNSSVVENIGPSCNNEVNFLADAVSETFPSKHDHEMSVKNFVYAAALTHTNCAADDNLNNDEDDQEENKKSSSTIEEINYSNITPRCEDKIAENTLSLTNINTAINSTSKILENVFEDIKENVSFANIISSNRDLNRKMNEVSTPVELTSDANSNSSDNMSLNMGDLSNNNKNILPITSLDNASPEYSFQESNNASLKSIAASATNHEKISIGNNNQDNLIESSNRNSGCNNNVTMCSDENTHNNDLVEQINKPVSKIFNPDTLLKICSTAIKTEYNKVNPEDVKNISVYVSVKISTPFNPIKSQKLTASNSIIKKNIRKKIHRILSKKDEIRIIKKACKRRTYRKYNAIKRRCKSPVKKLFLKDRNSAGSSKTVWKHQIKKPLTVLGTSRTLKSTEKVGGCTSKTHRKTVYHKKLPSNISVSENQVPAKPDTKTVTANDSNDQQSQDDNLENNLEASDKITRETDSMSSMQIYANDKTEKVVVTKIKLPSAYRRSKRIPKHTRKCVCTPKKDKIDRYDVMQTTLQTLNKCLPATEKYNEQFLSDITSSNNFIMTKFKAQPYDNDPHCKAPIIIHEDAVSKFPPSKRLSNIVVHKLETQNCSYINESAKENAKPTTNNEVHGNDIEATEQISFNDKKIIYLCKNDNVEKMISKVEQGIDANKISAMKKHNTNINQETGSEVTSESSSQAPVFKRPIKYVAAKLNNVFTLDKAPFSKRVKIFKPVRKPKVQDEKTITVDAIRKLFENLEKKDTEQFRIRREPIQTKDLILASKIFNKEEKLIENITDKSCSSHKTMPKIKDVLKIDKENFIKNTKLAEKCINIGNMKKKLFANICEDSGSQNTCDSKTS